MIEPTKEYSSGIMINTSDTIPQYVTVPSMSPDDEGLSGDKDWEYFDPDEFEAIPRQRPLLSIETTADRVKDTPQALNDAMESRRAIMGRAPRASKMLSITHSPKSARVTFDANLYAVRVEVRKRSSSEHASPVQWHSRRNVMQSTPKVSSRASMSCDNDEGFLQLTPSGEVVRCSISRKLPNFAPPEPHMEYDSTSPQPAKKGRRLKRLLRPRRQGATAA